MIRRAAWAARRSGYRRSLLLPDQLELVAFDLIEERGRDLQFADVVELQLADDDSVSLLFESFAYRRGVPADADFVFDARALPNPHWDPRMRPLSGRDVDVRTWFEGHAEVGDYSTQVAQFLDTWLPKMRSATRSYVTVAFGCSGGRHRSVYLAEVLARHAREQGWRDVATYHRELD